MTEKKAPDPGNFLTEAIEAVGEHVLDGSAEDNLLESADYLDMFSSPPPKHGGILLTASTLLDFKKALFEEKDLGKIEDETTPAIKMAKLEAHTKQVIADLYAGGDVTAVTAAPVMTTDPVPVSEVKKKWKPGAWKVPSGGKIWIIQPPPGSDAVEHYVSPVHDSVLSNKAILADAEAMSQVVFAAQSSSAPSKIEAPKPVTPWDPTPPLLEGATLTPVGSDGTTWKINPGFGYGSMWSPHILVTESLFDSDPEEKLPVATVEVKATAKTAEYELGPGPPKAVYVKLFGSEVDEGPIYSEEQLLEAAGKELWAVPGWVLTLLEKRLRAMPGSRLSLIKRPWPTVEAWVRGPLDKYGHAKILQASSNSFVGALEQMASRLLAEDPTLEPSYGGDHNPSPALDTVMTGPRMRTTARIDDSGLCTAHSVRLVPVPIPDDARRRADRGATIKWQARGRVYQLTPKAEKPTVVLREADKDPALDSSIVEWRGAMATNLLQALAALTLTPWSIQSEALLKEGW